MNIVYDVEAAVTLMSITTYYVLLSQVNSGPLHRFELPRLWKPISADYQYIPGRYNRLIGRRVTVECKRVQYCSWMDEKGVASGGTHC